MFDVAAFIYGGAIVSSLSAAIYYLIGAYFTINFEVHDEKLFRRAYWNLRDDIVYCSRWSMESNRNVFVPAEEANIVLYNQKYGLIFVGRVSGIDGPTHGKSRISITAMSLRGRSQCFESILYLFETYVTHTSRETTSICVFTPSGHYDCGWRRDGTAHGMRIESLIGARNRTEKIIDSITKFRAASDEYAKLGRPYHYGLLLNGPPGTGKTSTVRVLATHFNMEVRIFDTVSDNVARMFAACRDAIILIEDVDEIIFDENTLAAQEEKNKKVEPFFDHRPKRGVSLSQFLNALDGFITCNGCVVVMTTNKFTALDPRILRPGRVDEIFEFEYPSRAAFVELFLSHYPGEMALADQFAQSVEPNATMAKYQLLFLQSAHRTASEFVNDKRHDKHD